MFIAREAKSHAASNSSMSLTVMLGVDPLKFQILGGVRLYSCES